MNLSAPFLVQFFGEQMSAALAYCDYVFGNESEAAAFGEKQGWGSDVSAIALKLAGKIDKSNDWPELLQVCHWRTEIKRWSRVRLLFLRQFLWKFDRHFTILF